MTADTREMRDILRQIDAECGIVDEKVVTPSEEDLEVQRIARRFHRSLERPAGAIINPYNSGVVLPDFWRKLS